MIPVAVCGENVRDLDTLARGSRHDSLGICRVYCRGRLRLLAWRMHPRMRINTGPWHEQPVSHLCTVSCSERESGRAGAQRHHSTALLRACWRQQGRCDHSQKRDFSRQRQHLGRGVETHRQQGTRNCPRGWEPSRLVAQASPCAVQCRCKRQMRRVRRGSDRRARRAPRPRGAARGAWFKKH